MQALGDTLQEQSQGKDRGELSIRRSQKTSDPCISCGVAPSQNRKFKAIGYLNLMVNVDSSLEGTLGFII